MSYNRKKRILTVIRKSVLTGKAVWVSHSRSYQAEWKAYRIACNKEVNRMRQWGNIVNRRRRNIMRLLSDLTEGLPILGDMPPEQRAAAMVLRQMADMEPEKQSDFYDHLHEEKRQKRNAKRRLQRWQEKYGDNDNKQ